MLTIQTPKYSLPVPWNWKPAVRTSGVEQRLADILPDELTPREALDLIYELKTLTQG